MFSLRIKALQFISSDVRLTVSLVTLALDPWKLSMMISRPWLPYVPLKRPGCSRSEGRHGGRYIRRYVRQLLKPGNTFKHTWQQTATRKWNCQHILGENGRCRRLTRIGWCKWTSWGSTPACARGKCPPVFFPIPPPTTFWTPAQTHRGLCTSRNCRRNLSVTHGYVLYVYALQNSATLTQRGDKLLNKCRYFYFLCIQKVFSPFHKI